MRSSTGTTRSVVLSACSGARNSWRSLAPGGFPGGIRLDSLFVAPPHPRSPLLADAFKRTGLAGRTGRGIKPDVRGTTSGRTAGT